MKIISCSFEKIFLHPNSNRQGILLQLKNEEGKNAISEISPLPRYSRETLEEAFSQLEAIKTILLNTRWNSVHLLNQLSLYPSVHFGIESAILDLLKPIPKTNICKKYALLFGTFEEILSKAEEVIEEGYYEAKIKLGSFSLESAHRLIERIGNRLHLRIDLNRQWNVEKSLAFFSCYPKDYFEYVEEPVQNLKDLSIFSYPFALDETLRENPDLSLLVTHPKLKAFVVKPMLTYPLSSLMKFSHQLVLSSSFEGVVGIRQIEKLILRSDFFETFHGLDTLRYNGPSMPHSLLETAKP